ncbi:MAG TPA: exodeoxyribonuclease VII large subunit [Gammaproteobacteria bacterium]|nr:exodeoxyribonuclease VII large subunit [Gammaproteobacteria bacterium]
MPNLPKRPATTTDNTPGRDIYSVSRLNQEVRDLLDSSFPLLWIEGEISNLARPASGHLYFTLKDANAQVRCALFRNRARLLACRPENGLQVLLRARVSLYEGRGDYQIIAEHLEPAGDGALRRAYEELKNRLQKEGLFDPDRKQELPSLPKQIGIITSPSGAAVHDALSVLHRRFAGIPVIIYPVAVQGADAARQIAAMIKQADLRDECDVLLLTRGGGSLEDLMAFNDERVARAISNCTRPLVAAVGHEVDFTIADFVADVRAPTPSAAAELLSPDSQDWLQQTRQLQRRLTQTMQQHTDDLRQSLSWLSNRLTQQHPQSHLQQQMQLADGLESRLRLAIRQQLDRASSRLVITQSRLQSVHPDSRINSCQQQLGYLQSRLKQVIHNRINVPRQTLSGLSRALNSVSPLATLERGYSITRTLPDGDILTSVASLSTGDTVNTRLSDGEINCVIEKITGKDS